MDLAESHHLTHVLRKKVGDIVKITSGRGDVLEGKVLKSKDEVIVEILSTTTTSDLGTPQIILAPALIKGPRMDWLIEKATELGASQILPFISERGVVKVKTEKDALNKIRRWQRISEAALKQSQRSLLPQIGPIPSFEGLMERFQEVQAHKILLCPKAPPLKNLEEKFRTKDNLLLWLLVIGPEGGLTAGEIRIAEKAGFLLSSLGHHTLRAETAALAALVILNFICPTHPS